MSLGISLLLGAGGWLRGISAHAHRYSLAAAFLWLWMWMLIFGNTGNPDLEGYLYFYEAKSNPSGVGPGYWLLVETARSTGLDYTTFLAICSGFCIATMASVAAWLTDRTALVASFYFLYPFAFDAIQARNMLGMSIVILAFAVRAKYVSRSGKIGFAALVLVASTIHLTMLVFGVAFFVRASGASRTAAGLMLAGVVAVPIAAIFPSSLGPAAELLLGQLDSNRFDSYFETRAEFGIVLFVCVHLASVAVLRSVFLKCLSAPDGTVSSGQHNFVGIVYRTAMVLTLLLPFVAINSNFFRLLRDLWFLYAIVFAIGIEVERRLRTKRTIALHSAVLLIAQCAAFVLFSYSNVPQPILENNRFFEAAEW